MEGSISDIELGKLNASIDALQASARRTIPMFAIGILATLFAAGVALWYIFTLTAQLQLAQSEMWRTQNRVIAARASLFDVQRELKFQLQAKKNASPTDAGWIAAVLTEVEASQQGLKDASDSINRTEEQLPLRGTDSEKLLMAARNNDLADVERYLTSETFNARTIDGMNALMVAADKCYVGVGRFILGSGIANADINARNVWGDTALAIAEGTPKELRDQKQTRPRCPELARDLRNIGAR